MIHRQTRLAPTPSGFLHLGNVLSFAVTSHLAKRSGAGILLRIDDMDRERVQPEYLQDIFETLSFLDIPFDQGPVDITSFETGFSQRHRLSMYNKALAELRDLNAVFACTCSRSQLAAEGVDSTYPGTCRTKNIPLDTPGAAWRLLTDERPLPVKDISGDQISFQLPKSMCDFIVRRKDGYPAYQLSSLLDDLFWDVDLIVRGEDLLPSTIAQMFLASIMKKQSFSNAYFYHHVLLTSSDGRKFSKSAGDTSVHFLRRIGATSEEVFLMAGEMLGLKETSNWEMLGTAVMGLQVK